VKLTAQFGVSLPAQAQWSRLRLSQRGPTLRVPSKGPDGRPKFGFDKIGFESASIDFENGPFIPRGEAASKSLRHTMNARCAGL
jgi:hypothetical protein